MFQNLCENTEIAERETLSPKFTPKRGWQLPSLFFDRNDIYILCFLKYFVCNNSWDLWLKGSPKYSLYSFMI